MKTRLIKEMFRVSTKEIIKHKLTIRDRMIKSGNMKLLNELFVDDGSQSITKLVVRHGKSQSLDIEMECCEKSFNETLAEIYSNNPGLVNVHKKVTQTLMEKGLL